MKPFLHGRKPSPLAAASPRTAAVPAAPPGLGSVVRAVLPSAMGGDPQIEVVKEGDKVVRLVITCSCGERMEVECIYPAGA